MKIKTTRWLKLLFPTEVAHDDKQVIITYHQLFSSQTHTIDIKDLLNVEIDSMLWFSSITFTVRGIVETTTTTPENILSIPKFWKKEATLFVNEIETIRKQYI